MTVIFIGMPQGGSLRYRVRKYDESKGESESSKEG